ncbi:MULTISPECIES: hypothetical protein [Streptococcus]|uniref:Uncharacterized protein n=1 Tax=Streptococcus pseudoporcinus TaxID=361101 RepID=A0A4U9XIZ3_9STRE|nr:MULTISPECIES: hypothetical protein [Streptococcus]QBX28192.1 hypothetical protein Javan444_0030 [Streptococcus phage Javan444]MCR4258253.1 hypothetical protein [Streptococcus uberis]VTS13204.1 Uncharacterised protein [Streptococcus pseudoporcinus]VUC66414.1 Uncharacterised protein [Streptococcus pseudoporcinus]VUC97342.1 Uncharacterised protein [Streptococcus pseudoporcinus]
MNKRQRKKMFTRAFSKAYDESLKWQRKKEQVSITTVRDRRGKAYIITSIISQVEIMKNWTDSPEEITIEGYMLDNKRLGLK